MVFSSSYKSVSILRMSYGNWAKLNFVVSLLYYLCLLNLKQFQACKRRNHTRGYIIHMGSASEALSEVKYYSWEYSCVSCRGQCVPSLSVPCMKLAS